MPAKKPAAEPSSSSATRTNAARAWRPRQLPGVECMAAAYTTHSFSRHFHRRYAIGCIEAGAMAFRYLGSSMVAPAGQVNLVVPGEVHDGHAALPEGWRYRMFYLDADLLARAWAELAPRRLGAGLPFIPAGVLDDPWLASRVLTLHQSLDAHPELPALRAQVALAELLVGYLARHAQHAPAAPPTLSSLSHGASIAGRAVALAREAIEDRLAEDLSLDELAGLGEVSPFHLVRSFRSLVGLPPHAYLIQCRVRRARECIAAGEGLAEAALACGFADQSHLTRAFRAHYGLPPGAWRKNLQEK